MGTDPRWSGVIEAAPLVLVSTNPLRLKAQRRTGLANAAWVLESATSLQTWQATEITPQVVSLTNDLETLEWQCPATAAPVFYRLKIVTP